MITKLKRSRNINANIFIFYIKKNYLFTFKKDCIYNYSIIFRHKMEYSIMQSINKLFNQN